MPDAFSFGTAIGAGERTNLEPASLASVLDELEDWNAVLKAEPEVIHKLREFEVAVSDEGGGANPDNVRLTRSRKPPVGPSL